MQSLYHNITSSLHYALVHYKILQPSKALKQKLYIYKRAAELIVQQVCAVGAAQPYQGSEFKTLLQTKEFQCKNNETVAIAV